MTGATEPALGRARPVLLLGLPRSGSTWTARVLGEAPELTLVSEPDDPYRWPSALWAKATIGDYPTEPAALARRSFRDLWSDVATSPERFGAGSEPRHRLGARLLIRIPPPIVHRIVGSGQHPLGWPRTPFGLPRSGSRPAPSKRTTHRPPRSVSAISTSSRLLIKSVSLSLCAKAVADWLDADVMVVRRDPRKVIGSWSRMTHFFAEPLHENAWVQSTLLEPRGISVPRLETELDRVAWTVALLDLALSDAAEERGWPVFNHETLTADPQTGFARMLSTVDATFSAEAKALIDDSNQSGAGYEINRTQEQIETGWSKALGKAEHERVEEILAAVGHNF